ncbi:MAG: mannose-6-phosphate isomerase, class I, partial [Actinobacteria bacterium]|nr:mannose-6-phosphate isomerase, class I [Actinomycetota bacterium]
MLILIENAPRAYAWGSRDALPELLGTAPNGEPQAELWLGAHPGAPARVAGATPVHRTLIDLIEADPDRYGVGGGQLPFLLKILAIGGPLSLQVHPNR